MVAYRHGCVPLAVQRFQIHSQSLIQLEEIAHVSSSDGRKKFVPRTAKKWFWKHKQALVVSFTIKYKNTFTFLNFAAPAPERMASNRACLASFGFPEAVEEDLGATADSWMGGGGGGWAGAGGIHSCSSWRSSAFCKDCSASLKCCSSWEATEEICSSCSWKKVVNIKHG